MNTLFFVILVLFTNAGPAQVTKQAADLHECNEWASMAYTMVDKEVPGPDGTPALILDAQAKCIVFSPRIEIGTKK
jgi:hypothetical protein